MKHTLLFATIASFVVVHAYANNIVTSKTYVDNRDALKVDIAQGTGDNNANVGKTLVVNSSGNLELGTPAAGNYVEDSITDDVTTKAPSENAVHDALANKQDTITTAEVEFDDLGTTASVPALLSYDSTNGLTGSQIGFLDLETYADLNSGFEELPDTLVPSVALVQSQFADIWGNMPSVTPITWNSNDATAVNNYSTSFTGTGNWPSAHEDQYVTGSSLAQGLALKQNKIPVRQTKIKSGDSTYAPSVVTNGTTDGSVGQMAIITRTRMTDDDMLWDDYNNESLIPTLGAVAKVVEDNTINWHSMDTAAVNNYSTTFNGTTNNWPTYQVTPHVSGEFLAKVLALKQNRQIGASPVGNANSTDAGKVLVVGNDGEIAMGTTMPDTSNFQTKIPARATKIESTDSTYAPSVVTNGTTDGSVGQMAILTNARVSVEDGADGGEFADYTDGDSLIPTAAAVGAELSYKQNILGGTPEYAGKVVTATDSPGVVTYTATYDGSGTYTAATDAGKIATAAAVETKQDKKTCAGWLDGTTVPDATHTDANCVLWNLPD